MKYVEQTSGTIILFIYRFIFSRILYFFSVEELNMDVLSMFLSHFIVKQPGSPETSIDELLQVKEEKKELVFKFVIISNHIHIYSSYI